MRTLAAAALLASAVLSAPAAADDAIRLARRDAAGTAWTFDETVEVKMRNAATLAAPGAEPEVTDHAMKSIRRVTVTFLAVDEKGLATSVRLAYDASSADVETADGVRAEPAPFALAGKTVTISRSADGSIKHDHAGELPEDVVDEIDDFLPRDGTILPDHPVKPGDTWKPSERAVAEWLDLDAGAKATVSCKFVGRTEVGGRRAAAVHVSVQLTAEEDGLVTELKGEGTMMIDVETGYTLEETISGRATLRGTQKDEDGEGRPLVVKISGEGTMSGHGKSRPAPALAK
jgi:hypothetical protein